MLPSETCVLVVGAGPSGILAAILLERLGLDTVLVDRRAGSQRAPAAHVLNARTLEICRAAGVDAKRLADAAVDPADARYAYWVTQLGGRVLGRLGFERQGDDQLAHTPTPIRNLSQNRFEPILLDTLEAQGGGAPHWRHEWITAEQDADGVRARVRDPETGREQEIASRYLIAADGAGSRVRKSLDIAVTGPDRLQSFVMIHFRTPLRGTPEVPPGLLFFVCDPACAGAFVVHDLDREAVFMHAFDPDVESLADYDTRRCEAILRAAMADPPSELRVETVSTWTMTAQVAEQYRQGRIFLVGDAAHRFPPTGGLGLNTGAQDVHNLAWKLAAVERGSAPASLLDSYETERRPVAQANADQSLRNALRLFEVQQALGVSDASEASRARMLATLADPDGRARVRDAIEAQAEHFDMPGLQLGFGYERGALLRDEGDAFEATRDPRSYVPSACPGRRLPHTWVRDASGAAAGAPTVAPAGGRASLLDWVPLDRFLLLVGPDARPWLDAAAGLAGPPLAVRHLTHAEVPDLDAWLRIAGIAADGAILVRPDQHVAWRAPRAVDDPAAALGAALAASISGGA